MGNDLDIVAAPSTLLTPDIPQRRESPTAACLIVVLGPDMSIGDVHRLRSGRSVLGRAKSADLRIPDSGVSRHHAQICIQDGRATIEDLGSANGTIVNGVRVARADLREGDDIRLGFDALLKFSHIAGNVTKISLPARSISDEPADAGTKEIHCSTFISYGGPDEPFARKLNQALQEQGVATFFFPENAIPGERIHRTVRKKIQEHERVILVCSRASLDRKGVLTEIEETISREYRDSADYLIPIRLDDYVLTEWKPKNPDLAQAILDRVVADFEGADSDDEKFRLGLRKLIEALKK